MADPNLQRQIRNLDDMIRASQRSMDNLKQQLRLFERQKGEAKRLPNATREQARIQEQIRQTQRDMDRLKGEVRTMDRQRGELKRMAR